MILIGVFIELCPQVIYRNFCLTLNDAGGGQNDPLGTDKACMPSIFIKTSQFIFLMKAIRFQLRMIQIGPRGR